MPGDDEPGLGTPRPIRYDEGEMLGRVARDVEHPGVHVAEPEDVAILHRAEGKPEPGRGVQEVLGTRGRGQLTAGGEMVGVYVGIDDVAEPEPHGGGRVEVALGLAHGINDSAGGMTAAAEEIRRGDHRVGVQKLAQDHYWASTA